MREALTRRRVLAACGAVATAGCLSGGDPPLGLQQIEITNYADTDVTVDVTVVKGEEIVYDSTIPVESEHGHRVVQIRRDWMGDRVYYEGRFSTVVNGQRLEASSDSFALVGDDGDYGEMACFALHADVYPDEILTAHGYSDTCEPPTTETSTE
ncbi:hypothetical protein [Halobaculum sp. MBLA0143]|uniref:hypothetical protein n=1 Tax=Halobaculum sp. MBLA0143 TaxID=3079933 RepID=UPI003523BDF8